MHIGAKKGIGDDQIVLLDYHPITPLSSIPRLEQR